MASIFCGLADALSFDDYLVDDALRQGCGLRQCLMSCNPDHENHWLNRKIIEAQSDDISSSVWISPDDNPVCRPPRSAARSRN